MCIIQKLYHVKAKLLEHEYPANNIPASQVSCLNSITGVHYVASISAYYFCGLDRHHKCMFREDNSTP